MDGREPKRPVRGTSFRNRNNYSRNAHLIPSGGQTYLGVMETKPWNIDTAHSSIGFAVRHMVFAKVRGRFGSWSGTVRLDPDALARSSVEVDIDAASIDTGVADRDAHLRSADFLDVERFPRLRFRSPQVERVDDAHLRVTGQLTIRDVTAEVVLEVELGGFADDPWGNRRAAFTASTSIDRKAFGLTWNQVLEAGGVLVGERIDIELEVQAVEPAATRAA
jgi:polyisoprenoid-binding protein YceI